MRNRFLAGVVAAFATVSAHAGEVCQGFGPQAPRDISLKGGRNAIVVPKAPDAAHLNLCNIHFHAAAEHKGPGFAVLAGKDVRSGFACNAAKALTAKEKAPIAHGACHGLQPGQTIEVHWVFTSCDAKPGKGLEACVSARCANPTLRVESQVFLLVNDRKVAQFTDFAYAGPPARGVHQPKALPAATGKPVVFTGSTTGPEFSEVTCSPMAATWSVRPSCQKLDIASLDHWCEKNVFEENHAHGVRPIVTTPELLSKID